jgi:hypothetical protein
MTTPTKPGVGSTDPWPSSAANSPPRTAYVPSVCSECPGPQPEPEEDDPAHDPAGAGAGAGGAAGGCVGGGSGTGWCEGVCVTGEPTGALLGETEAGGLVRFVLVDPLTA